MTPSRCPTLVGLPRLDEEPFELRPRMVRLPTPSVRIRTPTRRGRAQPRRKARPWLQQMKEIALSAAVAFAAGSVLVGFAL